MYYLQYICLYSITDIEVKHSKSVMFRRPGIYLFAVLTSLLLPYQFSLIQTGPTLSREE